MPPSFFQQDVVSSIAPQAAHVKEVLQVYVFTVSVTNFNKSIDAAWGCYGNCREAAGSTGEGHEGGLWSLWKHTAPKVCREADPWHPCSSVSKKPGLKQVYEVTMPMGGICSCSLAQGVGVQPLVPMEPFLRSPWC